MSTAGRRLQLLDVVAETVKTARRNANWTQRELSRRSGVPQAHICRIERGEVSDLPVGVVDRLFAALGVRYWLGTDLPHVIRLQSDFVHARCSVYASRRLTSSGWLVEREVEIGSDRSRGWIDILAFHPESGMLLIIEVKTEVHDLGAIERSLSWYRREALRAARRLGWEPRSIGSALLILQSRVNDDRSIASSHAFATGFPGRAAALHAVIDGESELGGRQFLAMIDPRSRRAAWLRATRSDGRRTPAPYVDYIDAARQLERRPTARKAG
jgi:transcriptional regulator with XRE-family HTH domain